MYYISFNVPYSYGCVNDVKSLTSLYLLCYQGNIVYANYARIKDYEWLESQNISINGSIVLARYGKVWRASKVRHSTHHKAK